MQKIIYTYQMEECTGQDTVDSEIDATLHAQKTGHAKCLQDCLLQSAQKFCRGIAYHHMVFPASIEAGGFHESELRPVKHNDTQIVIGVKISDEVKWQPGRRTVLREGNLQVFREVIHPGVEGRVKLHEVRIDAPVFLLLDSRVHSVHPPNVANDSGEVGEIACDMVFGVVTAWYWSWYTQIQSFHFDS